MHDAGCRLFVNPMASTAMNECLMKWTRRAGKLTAYDDGELINMYVVGVRAYF